MAAHNSIGAVVKGGQIDFQPVELNNATLFKYFTLASNPPLSPNDAAQLISLPAKLQAFIQQDNRAISDFFAEHHIDLLGMINAQGGSLKDLLADLNHYRADPSLLQQAFKFEKNASGSLTKIHIELPDGPIGRLLGQIANPMVGRSLKADANSNAVAGLLAEFGLSPQFANSSWQLAEDDQQPDYMAKTLQRILQGKLDDDTAKKYAGANSGITNITATADANIIWCGNTYVSISKTGVYLSDANSPAATAFTVDALIALNGKNVPFNVSIKTPEGIPAFKALCHEILGRGLKLDAETKENYHRMNEFLVARNGKSIVPAPELIN